MTGPGAVKTREFVTRRSHETYTVTTEPVGQQCSGRSPYPARCQNEGEGWLYDPSRPPAYAGVQFACRECADVALSAPRTSRSRRAASSGRAAFWIWAGSFVWTKRARADSPKEGVMESLAHIGRRDARIGAVAESARRNGIANIGIVGGYVRDALLGGEPRDLDVVVEGLTPGFVHDLAVQLGGIVEKASEFGTYSIALQDGEDVDVATARTETYEKPAALPTVTPGSFGEDMARRDFSVNAMAIRVEPADGALSLYDPVGGMADLENGTIRVLHEDSFADDPTRIFRAVRYAVRLDFSIEPQTGSLMDEAIERYLPLLSRARVGAELRKTWECDRAGAVFFELVGHRVFKSLDPALHTSPLACMAAHWLAASDYPRDLAFAAALGLMVEDDSASRRVADRLGMGKAEARVLMTQPLRGPGGRRSWTRRCGPA